MNQDDFLSHQIIKQLRQCGHFLHFRMGGKAGRRRILSTLLTHPELLQRDLQDILEVQSGSLSEMITKMEADGLVEKVKSQKDGRQLVLTLTPEGTAQAKRSQEEYDKRVEKMMSCFSVEEQQKLHELLETMVAHWKEIEHEMDFPPTPSENETQNRTSQTNE
jgi:DNA-binding MarR family transcriptional regulator